MAVNLSKSAPLKPFALAFANAGIEPFGDGRKVGDLTDKGYRRNDSGVRYPAHLHR